jgi:spherulation-specific family 4 protein
VRKLALIAGTAAAALSLLIPASAGASAAGAARIVQENKAWPTARVRPQVTPQPLHIVIPAYWYQNIPSWSELASDDPVSSYDGTLTVSNAILNPCAPSGKTCSPGAVANPATLKNLQQEEAVGITFYGYVATGYAKGGVTIAKAEKEMADYHKWYGLDDMFLDEAATSCSAEKSYYLKLYDYVHQTFGGKVILNPGTTTNSCYMAASDMIDIFEGDPSGLASFTPPGWMHNYPPSRFIAIVYDTPSGSLTSTLATAGQDGFGNAYVTDQAEPNPYAQLPGYWSSEAADVSGG